MQFKKIYLKDPG